MYPAPHVMIDPTTGIAYAMHPLNIPTDPALPGWGPINANAALAPAHQRPQSGHARTGLHGVHQQNLPVIPWNQDRAAAPRRERHQLPARPEPSTRPPARSADAHHLRTKQRALQRRRRAILAPNSDGVGPAPSVIVDEGDDRMEDELPPVFRSDSEHKSVSAYDRGYFEVAASPRNAESTTPPPPAVDLGLPVVMYTRAGDTEPTPSTAPTVRNAEHDLRLRGQMDEIFTHFQDALHQGPLIPVTPTIVSTVLERQEIFAKAQARQPVREDITMFFMQKRFYNSGGSDKAIGNWLSKNQATFITDAGDPIWLYRLFAEVGAEVGCQYNRLYPMPVYDEFVPHKALRERKERLDELEVEPKVVPGMPGRDDFTSLNSFQVRTTLCQYEARFASSPIAGPQSLIVPSRPEQQAYGMLPFPKPGSRALMRFERPAPEGAPDHEEIIGKVGHYLGRGTIRGVPKWLS